MLLRSGKVYDSSFPWFLKEFCVFGNPEFGKIWDEAAGIYHTFMVNNTLYKGRKRDKEASKLFRNHIYTEARKIYQQCK